MSAPGSSVMRGASRWLAASAGPVPRAASRLMPASPDFQGLVFIQYFLPRWLCDFAGSFPAPRLTPHYGGAPGVGWVARGMDPKAAPDSYCQPLKGPAVQLKGAPERMTAPPDAWAPEVERAASGDADGLAQLY